MKSENEAANYSSGPNMFNTARNTIYIYIYIYIYACQYTWRHTQRTAENVVVSTILYPVGRFHTFIGHEGP